MACIQWSRHCSSSGLGWPHPGAQLRLILFFVSISRSHHMKIPSVSPACRASNVFDDWLSNFRGWVPLKSNLSWNRISLCKLEMQGQNQISSPVWGNQIFNYLYFLSKEFFSKKANINQIRTKCNTMASKCIGNVKHFHHLYSNCIPEDKERWGENLEQWLWEFMEL